MKKLKILLVLALALALMAIALSSCGGDDKDSSTPSANSSEVSNDNDKVDDTNDNTTNSTINSGSNDNDDTNDNDDSDNNSSSNNDDSNNNEDDAVDETRVVIDGVVYTLDESGTYYQATELQAGYGENIVIQEECNGKSVVRLATKLFENISGVKSISIPKTITEIGYRCFANCSDLTSINVAEENTVYKSIDGNLYSFDEETLVAYAIGKASESFVVPESVHRIDDYAFKGCTAIKNVQFSSKLYSIGSFSFEGCTSLNDVVFPQTLDTTGMGAFARCTSIETITITRNLEVGPMAFAYCTSLKEILVEKKNYRYTSIDGNLYYVDEDFALVQYAIGKEDTHFEVPKNTRRIGEAAFCGAENLVSVSTGEAYGTIRAIDIRAFKDCINLERVYIDVGIENVGFHTFAGCEKLTIYCERSESYVKSQVYQSKWSPLWNPDNCPVEYDYVISK